MAAPESSSEISPIISQGSHSIAGAQPMLFKKHFEINMIAEWQSDYLHYDELSSAISQGPPAENLISRVAGEISRLELHKAKLENQFSDTQRKIPDLPKKQKKTKRGDIMAIGQTMARMILLYDQWNKLKSFCILNRQAVEDLLSMLAAATATKDPAIHARVQDLLAQFQKSKLTDLSVIESSQHGLEKKGLAVGVVSSGVRRPARLQQDIIQATIKYGEWLCDVLPAPVVKADIAAKLQHMADDSFMFLRATFYRWVQLWPVICPGLSGAPHVLAVGDLHIENYGTWRDPEGRWVWGINDFDEAFPMAYTIDLVRLSTSILFCADQKRCRNPDALIEKVLQGYIDSLVQGGNPIILEQHPLLAQLALRTAKDADRYWKRLSAIPESPEPKMVEAARSILLSSIPEDAKPIRFFHRVAGLGSLGRPRFVLLANWRGGIISREVKPAVPSACYFAAGQDGPYNTRQAEIILRAVRSSDPVFKIQDGWILRRLSPENGRLEFVNAKPEEELELFYRMGWELGNVHLGSPHAVANIQNDLNSRPKGWLANAALLMKQAIEEDQRVWRHHHRLQTPHPPQAPQNQSVATIVNEAPPGPVNPPAAPPAAKL